MEDGKLSMLTRFGITVLLVALALAPAEAQRKSRKDYLITLTTDAGPMRLVLSDKTPLHKANFIKLARENFYDGLLFHRVIQDFMIQGGDPDSRNAVEKVALGNGGVKYRIPAEFDASLFHRKGAVGAARDNNPEKASSGSQFYIVQGKPYTDETLDQQLKRIVSGPSGTPRKPTASQREVYRTVGGSPHLDGNYTVFGQVIDGLTVIDSIAARPGDARNRPLKDVAMQKVTVKKMRKKKITRQYGYVYE